MVRFFEAPTTATTYDWMEPIVEYLSSPHLAEKLRANYATLALIRPQVNGAVNFSSNDVPVKDALEEGIQNLGIGAKFPLPLDEQAVNELYETVTQFMLLKPAEHDKKLPSRWHEFTKLMTSGASVVLILESDESNAVQKWRNQLGSWDIENKRNPATLRGRFGVSNHNNLFHGSDSPDNASREVGIVLRCVGRLMAE